MAIDLDLFSAINYQSTIRNYCQRLGWKIADMNNRRTILQFTMDSGTDQTLFIIAYETTLEFSCPSGIKFGDIDDIPGWLSTLLLNENSSYKVGFWSIEKIAEKYHFSIMHNAEISLIDIEYFHTVVMKLVHECDKLEQTIARAMNNL
jgi:hypothetical protein